MDEFFNSGILVTTNLNNQYVKTILLLGDINTDIGDEITNKDVKDMIQEGEEKLKSVYETIIKKIPDSIKDTVTTKVC